MTNEQMNVNGFDYNSWKEQGQLALGALETERDTIAARLTQIDLELKDLRKKVGIKKEGPQRFRIKPLIAKFLEGKKNVKVADVVAHIVAERPGVTEEQVMSALTRFVNEMSNVTIKDDKIVISVAA
jgi:hypothetical protein